VEIFKDSDDIQLGAQWRKRLDEGLAVSTFLLPIITSSLLTSRPSPARCRASSGSCAISRTNDAASPVRRAAIRRLLRTRSGRDDAVDGRLVARRELRRARSAVEHAVGISDSTRDRAVEILDQALREVTGGQ
jgi:hypothetical protein